MRTLSTITLLGLGGGALLGAALQGAASAPNVVTGRVLNGELRGQALPGIVAAAIDADDKAPIDQTTTSSDGTFRLQLPAEVRLFRLYVYDRAARFYVHREREFTKIEASPFDVGSVTLYASLPSGTAARSHREEQVRTAQELASWGEGVAAEQLRLVLATNYPVEVAGIRCGAETATAQHTNGFPLPVSISSSRLGRVNTRIRSNEYATLGDIRTIVSYEAVYQSAFGHYATLSNLVRPPGEPAGMKLDVLEEGFLLGGRARSGYDHNLKVARSETRTASLLPLSLVGTEEEGFALRSCPESPGVSGTRYFYADQTGVLRFSLAPITDPGAAEVLR